MAKISFFSYFGENIIMRSSIQEFLIHIEKSKEKKIMLDFKKIKFISRSCADEYIKFLNKTDKEISESNLSPEVDKMLQLVKSHISVTFNPDLKIERRILCN